MNTDIDLEQGRIGNPAGGLRSSFSFGFGATAWMRCSRRCRNPRTRPGPASVDTDRLHQGVARRDDSQRRFHIVGGAQDFGRDPDGGPWSSGRIFLHPKQRPAGTDDGRRARCESWVARARARTGRSDCTRARYLGGGGSFAGSRRSHSIHDLHEEPLRPTFRKNLRKAVYGRAGVGSH